MNSDSSMIFDDVFPYLKDTSFKKDYQLYNPSVPIDNQRLISMLKIWHPDPRVFRDVNIFFDQARPNIPYILQVINGHWVCGVKRPPYIYIYDSYGTPIHYLIKHAKINDKEFFKNHIIVANAHTIYQFPYSAVCGAYAYFFCKGIYLYNDAYYYFTELFSIVFDSPEEWFSKLSTEFFPLFQNNDKKVYDLFMKEAHE